jgi:signal transduction histidine kinase
MKHAPRRKKAFFGLSGRVFLTVLGGLLIALVGLALVAVEALQTSTENTLQERLALAKVTAGRFDDFVAQTIRVTQTLITATGLDSRAATDEDHRRFAESLSDHLGTAAYYVAIVDPDFRARVVLPSQTDVLANDFSDSNCVNHAFDQRVPQVTRSFTLGTPTPAVAMVVPILTSDGAVSKVVLVTIDLNAAHFVDLLQPGELGQTGYIEVIDRTGIILGSTRPDRRWEQDDHGGFFQTLILERRTSVGTCHNCHDTSVNGAKSEDLVAFAPLSVAPWGIAVRQSRDEAFVYTDTLRRRMLVFGLLTVAAASIATLLLTRNLVKPLRGLTAACSTIADGNLDLPLPLRGPAEVGMLGDAFDTMREKLKASLDEINNWNDELEQLVAQRSQELATSREQLLIANRDLSTLNKLSFALTQSMDAQTTLETALASVAGVTEVERGWICLLEGEEGHAAVTHPSRTDDQRCLCQWSPAQSTIDRSIATAQAVENAVPLALSSAGELELEAVNGQRSLICIPLSAKGQTVGLLSLIPPTHRAPVRADLPLLTAVGAQVGIAVQNALLYRTLLEGEETQRELLHKVITAQEEERRRLARELHDETIQSLAALSVGLETALRAPAETPEDVQARLGPMKTLAAGVLQELQRMIQDLRPSLLDDLGLVPAIDWYAETRLNGQGTRLAWEITGPEQRLPTHVETTLFRIAQEAISNVAQHAGAENLRISLEYINGKVVFEVEDDGSGFDTAEVLQRRQGPGGYGLLGIRERVTLLHGALAIESQPGDGTRICVEIPMPGQKSGENGHYPRTIS